MNLILYLLIVLGTGFVAGVFRYRILVILFIAELVLACIMLIQALLSVFLVRISPQGKCWVAERGKKGFGILNIRSLAPLLLNRFSIRCTSHYSDGADKEKFKLTDSLNRGNLSLSFPIFGKYNGTQTVNFISYRVWDLFSLFSFRRKCRLSQMVAILPDNKEVTVEISQSTLALMTSENISINDPTRNRDEFRQIRDYVQGDPWKSVDWHKSAKADKLMVREYDKEAELFIDISLEGKGYSSASVPQLDGFYELLSSVIKGILRAGAIPRVSWRPGDESAIRRETLRDNQDINDFFVDLYTLGLLDPERLERRDPSGDSQEDTSDSAPTVYSHVLLTLGTDLVLKSGISTLRSFSVQGLNEEIESTRIIL